MAILTLNRVWINRLDSGESVAAYSWDRSQGYDQDGEVVTYAGGRQRSIAVEGERGTFQVTLRDITLATVEVLRSWQGLAVQVRDHRGQRWFGVFHAVTPTEHKDPSLYDAAITVRTVTVAEGV